MLSWNNCFVWGGGGGVFSLALQKKRKFFLSFFLSFGSRSNIYSA